MNHIYIYTFIEHKILLLNMQVFLTKINGSCGVSTNMIMKMITNKLFVEIIF